MKDKIRKVIQEFDSRESLADDLAALFEEEKDSWEVELVKKAQDINTKKHFCPFNDGEQNCECYLNGINAILLLLTSSKEEEKK